MAGGLFGQPFSLNEKCIVFSIMVMIVFLYCPTFSNEHMRYAALFMVFVVSYVSMAWYDYYHGCDIMPLKRGHYGVTSLFKPLRNAEKNKRNNETLTALRSAQVIYWSHIILFVPLLLYVAYNRRDTGNNIFSVLLFLGLFTAAYHCIKLVNSLRARPSFTPVTIYLTHLLLIAPLLIYVGYEKRKTNKNVFPLLGGIALLALGYHGQKVLSS